MQGWKDTRNKTHQRWTERQLVWAAAVVEYVNILYDIMQVKSNKGKVSVKEYKPVPKNFPYFGPHFFPPGYRDFEIRNSTPMITPQTMYLKPLTIIHPIYFPDIANCPRCDGLNVAWSNWTSAGYREVYGIRLDEFALGYQLRCTDCKEREENKPKQDRERHCWTTTSMDFWARRKVWDVPGEQTHEANSRII